MTSLLHVGVVSDIVCPWCYIGKRHLEAASARLAARADAPRTLQVAWHPYQLNPDLPSEGISREDYLQARYDDPTGGPAYVRIAEAGRAVGLEFDLDAITRQPNTFDAHRLLWLAGQTGHQDALSEALFAAYFLRGRDVGDRVVLTEIAAEAGLDAHHAAAFLEGPGGAEAVRADEAAARSLPTQGVPTFVAGRLALSGAQPPDMLVAFADHAATQLASSDAEAAAGDNPDAGVCGEACAT